MSLTPEQLAEIAARLPQALSFSDCSTQAEEDVATLLAELTRLQTALTAKDKLLDQIDESTKRIESKVNSLETNINSLVDAIKVKDHVLSQFANSENWTQYNGIWEWRSRGCPYSLANQVLEGKE